VQPNVLPDYWIWAYLLNYLAWILRSLVVNQFQSGAYNEPYESSNMTEGEVILIQYGFSRNGKAFTYEW